MTKTTTPNPYSIFTELRQAGWFRNFNVSQDGRGHLNVPVPGAPRVGRGDEGVLWFGHWTKLDGTTLYQRGNMDGSNTTIVLSPDGYVVDTIRADTLAESADEIRKLNVI
jgi:hypothetical protein